MTLQVNAHSEQSAVVQAYIAVVNGQDALNNTLRMDTLQKATEWYPLDLQLAIPLQATHVAFGFRMFGKGKVWLDEVMNLLPLTGGKKIGRFNIVLNLTL